MHTYIGPFRGFVLGWLLAAALGGGGVMWLARRAGLRRWQIMVVCLSVIASVLLGSKLLYLMEAWPHWLSSRFDAREAIFSAKMRIPGGLLFAIAIGPAVARAVGVRYLQLFDTIVPAAGLCIVGVRVGCFLEGCCFGSPSSVPWAVSFPANSPAFWWQVDQGLLSEDASATLPVHPLQLYFGAAGLLMFLVLLSYRHSKRYEGEVVLLFLLTYFVSTWGLELLRARPHDFTRQLMLFGSGGLAAAAAMIEWRWRTTAARKSPLTSAAIRSNQRCVSGEKGSVPVDLSR